jgi:hypothetical protein
VLPLLLPLRHDVDKEKALTRLGLGGGSAVARQRHREPVIQAADQLESSREGAGEGTFVVGSL